MRLLRPIWSRIIVESSSRDKLAMKELSLVLNVVFDRRLSSQIVVVLHHGESVILDHALRFRFACGDESLLILFALGLTELVAHDLPVAYLLVDGWVVDEGATKAR